MSTTEGSTVELHLQRLDATGDTTIPMRQGASAPDGGSTWTSDGNLLPADSRWDATVIIRDAGHKETGRTRFVFGLDATTIDEGLATPPIDPLIAIGLLLLGLALAGAIVVVARIRLPRVDPRTSRLAIAVAAAAAALLGVAILAAGPAL